MAHFEESPIRRKQKDGEEMGYKPNGERLRKVGIACHLKNVVSDENWFNGEGRSEKKRNSNFWKIVCDLCIGFRFNYTQYRL